MPDIKSPEDAIEEISQEIQSLRELKALTFHQDYIYKHQIKKGLDVLARAGNKDIVEAFSHYYRTNRNIIAYLWQEVMKAKHPELMEEHYPEPVEGLDMGPVPTDEAQE